MSELEETRRLLERAEQAAMSGNFASADDLLKHAARIQETELGPSHPDLATTLTNLAIVAEKTGRVAEAETLYRRAATIATAALPLNHPMAVESRQNLEDFCRAHGIPIHVPTAVTPTRDHDHERTAVALKATQEAPQAFPEIPKAPPEVPKAPPEVHKAPPEVPKPPIPSPAVASHSMAWLAAAVFLIAMVLLVWRPWSSPETTTQVNAPEPKPEEPALTPPPPTVAPDKPARKEPKVARGDREPKVTGSKPAGAAGTITLADAQVCRGFSTSGPNWRCEPAGSSVRPGPIVLYTRVKSPANTAVVHRWYQGNTLRQSVRLRIQGNATEGYRTYSRQTVSNGAWRVEVRSTDGALLHEQRFVVR